MKRFLMAAALAALPTAAQAGVGVTWFTGYDGGSKGFFTSGSALPTVDFHMNEYIIQVHALDLVRCGLTESLCLGGDFYMTTRRMKVNEDIGGVIQPGASLDIYSPTFDMDPLSVGAMGKVRMGAQTQKGMGFGIYVVPGIGLGMGGGELDFLYSGQLQISTWTNK